MTNMTNHSHHFDPDDFEATSNSMGMGVVFLIPYRLAAEEESEGRCFTCLYPRTRITRIRRPEAFQICSHSMRRQVREGEWMNPGCPTSVRAGRCSGTERAHDLCRPRSTLLALHFLRKLRLVQLGIVRVLW
jgi:hypothetical protein